MSDEIIDVNSDSPCQDAKYSLGKDFQRWSEHS